MPVVLKFLTEVLNCHALLPSFHGNSPFGEPKFVFM